MNSRSASAARFVGARTIEHEALGEEAFHRMISIERRRTTRSQKSFLLMLLDMGEHAGAKNNRASLRKIVCTLSRMLRETDVTGWYKEDSVVGVLFTEIAFDDQGEIPATMMNRLSQTMKDHLTPQQFHQIVISFHLLPEAAERKVSSGEVFSAVYPGVPTPDGATGTSL